MELWSIWLLIGVLCIGAELFIPGLVIIFFGFGAILTCLFSLIPFINNLLWLQILIFIVCSVASLLVLRKKFNFIFKGTVFCSDTKTDENNVDYADVLEPLSSIKEGRIKYRGTSWVARSSSEEIPEGNRVKVLRREGMTYIVEKI